MKVFLAGVAAQQKLLAGHLKKDALFGLESFYYVNSATERILDCFSDFMLDSGAFTFMQNSKTAVDWDAYIERYAAFIRRKNIDKFFELDIDSVVGYDQVKKYRKRLEKLSGKQCIPVWHKNRGMDDFKSMCDEYDYVAIGGIVSKEIKPNQYKVFPLMINEAHKRGAKIHGLGFTQLSWLSKCNFDSVDSTSWLSAGRFGVLYKFTDKTMIQIARPPGKRLSDSSKATVMNYLEWIKFQKYAEENL